jgi:beta-lactamase regulating signal transducer with metallopeptidase domain
MNPAGLESLGRWVLETCVVTAALAVAASVVCRALPRRPAVRHLLWTVVLARLCLPPVFEWPAAWLQPENHDRSDLQAVAHKPSLARNVPQATVRVTEPESPAIHAPLPFPAPETAPLPSVAPMIPEVLRVAAPVPPSVAPGLPETTRLGRHSTQVIATAFDWWPSLCGLWLAGSLVELIRQFVGVQRLLRILKTSTPAPASIQNEANAICQRLGLRAIIVELVDGIAVPCVVWIGRTRLLWPRGCSVDPPSAAQRGMLAHELAHIRRGDHLWQWLELAIRSVWWWNPICHWARRQAAAAAEEACDVVAVATADVPPRHYAELLLELSARPARLTHLPALGWQGTSRTTVERRLKMILTDRVSARVSPLMVFAAALVALVSWPGWMRAESPRKSEPGSEPQPGSGQQPTTIVIENGTAGSLAIDPTGRLLGEGGPSGSGLVIETTPVTRYGMPARDGRVMARWRSMLVARSGDDQTTLRLKAMYYEALAEGRQEDANALAAALTALGSSPDGEPQPMMYPYPGGYDIISDGTATPPLYMFLKEFRGHIGLSARVTVTGSNTGSVWGSGTYTDDSDLGTAAVHAGLVEVGETQEVLISFLGPQQGFAAGSANGVTTREYGAWDGSYQLAPVDKQPHPLLLVAPQAKYGDVYTSDAMLRLQDFVPADQLVAGTGILTVITGYPTGSVWGSEVYTADSSLAAAAVHAGVLQSGESGVVIITLSEGRNVYGATTRNGVETRSWESYPTSMTIERVHPTSRTDEAVKSEDLFRPL